jgi:enoyl-CoA hydratase/carnithine racemase
VIAAVQGIATAAGCQLVATCDLAIASSEARFATPGVRIGLFCSTPMVAVSRNIGRKRALEMLLTGKPISAQTAADWGLVNRVVPPDQLEAAALELAGQVASSSPLTLKIGKQAFYEQIGKEQDAAYDLMGEVMSKNAMTGDAQEGMSAFLEKRDPTWRGE